jgi:2',3'-cyclic-nucleotide 2'-phosphodiesterase/3'-nucleotidase
MTRAGAGRSRPVAAGVARTARLRLMATSDLHMALQPWDYHADSATTAPGLSGVLAIVDRLRKEQPASLLFDCGDFLQGGPMADYLAFERGLAPGEPHPMIAAMNAAGYAAVALGNHEFNYGLPFLERALADARFPVLCSNLMRRLGAHPLLDRPLVVPHLLLPMTLDRDLPPLRLGLIGLAPPQVLQWEREQLDGRLQARSMVEAAVAHVAALRGAGAELVKALVHGGILEEGDAPDLSADPPTGPPIGPAAADGVRGARGLTEGIASTLAALDGLDVLMLGHAHEVFPGPRFRGMTGIDGRAGRVLGKPAVMPGLQGSHLGVIDLTLERAPQGWRLADSTARALPVPQTARPAGLCPVRRATAAAHAATRAHMAQPVGRTAVALHSYFAPLADGAALRLVAEAQRRWGEAAVAGRPEARLPLLSAVAPFRLGGRAGPLHYTDVPAGPLLLRHLHDLYAFPNTLRLLRLTGEQVAEWLERTAGLYSRLAPDRPDTPLLEAEAPGYSFDMIHGLDYAFDLGVPARYRSDGRRADGVSRLRGLAIAGRPLRWDEDVLVVTNNYRAAGGGGFPGTGSAARVVASGPTNRAALLAHIRACPEIDSVPRPGGWRLVAPAGSTAILDTGPGAAAHLAEIGALRPESLGRTPRGFLRLRLRF